MIQQEMHKSQQVQRFNLNSIPRHTHNGIDSPSVFQPVFSYAGQINPDGTVVLLPSGWTITVSGTGVYTITHKLNTLLYTVNANCIFVNSYNVVSITKNANNFIVNTFFYPATPFNSGFMFNLTNINNKSTIPPGYYGSSVTPIQVPNN